MMSTRKLRAKNNKNALRRRNFIRALEEEESVFIVDNF